MTSFQAVTPLPRLFSGADSLTQLPRELERLKCRRAVVVCGASLQRRSSLLDKIETALGANYAGMAPSVRSHSPIPAVMAVAAELERLSADAVVAVGGGSAVVTARAATILLAESRDVRSLCTSVDANGALVSPRLLAPKLPQFIVPTTPNTAQAKAGTAVFDPSSGERLALFDPKTRAHAVFVDPDFVQSAPPGLVAAASLDTFSLAAEGLLSKASNPLSDATLMHAVRLLSMALTGKAWETDVAVRMELVHAALLCGWGTDFTGAGVATVLGHAIGGRYELDNGLVKAVVLPHAVEFNADYAEAGLRAIAESLRPPAPSSNAAAVANALATLSANLGLPSRLRDLGLPHAALPQIAEDAMRDWFLRSNPRPVRSDAELQELLEAAW
jgi:alcohol dehydrogenase class IV